MARPPARAWQRMLSGRRLDLLDPSPVDVEIEDIAHGLSFVARWNGQTSGDFPYSVAEHSLLVERLMVSLSPNLGPQWRLAALLHDAPEYVIGDMISPVKAAIGGQYKALEERLTAAIHIRFGLPATLPARIKKQIKTADNISAWIEAVRIAGFSEAEADKLFQRPPQTCLAEAEITLRPPSVVRSDFAAATAALLAECDARMQPAIGR